MLTECLLVITKYKTFSWQKALDYEGFKRRLQPREYYFVQSKP